MKRTNRTTNKGDTAGATLDDLLDRNRQLAADNIELLDISDKLIAIVHQHLDRTELMLTNFAVHGCSPATAAKCLLDICNAKEAAAARASALAKEVQ